MCTYPTEYLCTVKLKDPFALTFHEDLHTLKQQEDLPSGCLLITGVLGLAAESSAIRSAVSALGEGTGDATITL